MVSSKDSCPVCRTDSTQASESWIQCDVCRSWFHTHCVKLTRADINTLHSYHCQDCAVEHGQSVFKRKSKRARVQIDYVALNEGEVFAVDKSAHPHVGSFLAFQPEIKHSKVNIDESQSHYIDVLQRGDLLNKNYALLSGLNRPVLVPQADADLTGMRFPISPDQITVRYIEDKVGGDTTVEVMDVLTQQGVAPSWNLSQWREYFYTDAASRDRIRNVISLEVSQVEGLGKDFIRPRMVREMDLVDKVWYAGADDKASAPDRPQVTTYCLMSVGSSYTDFHLDFSGTCVYYTVCRGSKTFLMYPPTEENLQLYTAWCLEPNQNFMWFGDYTKSLKGKGIKEPSGGFKVTLSAGDLFIIPSGWIHAVYTPEDSVVIGGNYLSLSSLDTHLAITEIEKKTKVPAKFRFPMFNKVLWLTSWYYYNHPEQFAEDVDALAPAEQHVKQENHDNDTQETTPKGHMISVPSEQTQHVKQENQETSKNAQETTAKGHMILDKLIEQLAAHYELSKTSPVAKRSVPTNLIGRDVDLYLNKLRDWHRSMEVVSTHAE